MIYSVDITVENDTIITVNGDPIGDIDFSSINKNYTFIGVSSTQAILLIDYSFPFTEVTTRKQAKDLIDLRGAKLATYITSSTSSTLTELKELAGI